MDQKHASSNCGAGAPTGQSVPLGLDPPADQGWLNFSLQLRGNWEQGCGVRIQSFLLVGSRVRQPGRGVGAPIFLRQEPVK